MGKPEGGNGSSPKPEPLAPHPLVVGLAASLFGDKSPREAYGIAKQAKDVKFHDGAKSLGGNDIVDAVEKFVDSHGRRELVKFAGYLGDAWAGSAEDGDWQVLFFDDTADNYIAMRVKDIAFRDRVHEDTAAFGELDVLWLEAEAPVFGGDRSQTLRGRFTAGEFMRAGDFNSSMSGGTLTSVSDLGPLCTAFTPCCCKRNSS